MPDPQLIRMIDALLPQTQCGQCGHPGCRPYAEAMAAGEAINHCVPGGQATIDALAGLLGQPSLALDPEYGVSPTRRLVAYIREAECIGCTKCIQACPVDAIVGAAKLMHTVMMDECTGCDLCVAPCPVDCIDMVPGPDIPVTWHRPADTDPATRRVTPEPARALTPGEAEAKSRADRARRRFEAHTTRLAAETAEKIARREARQAGAVTDATPAVTTADPAALMIAAAMARSQLKKAEKQLAALQARGEPAHDIDAALPALRAAVSQTQAALAQAQRGEAVTTAAVTPASSEAPPPAAPVRTGPGSKRVRTTGEIR